MKRKSAIRTLLIYVMFIGFAIYAITFLDSEQINVIY